MSQVAIPLGVQQLTKLGASSLCRRLTGPELGRVVSAVSAWKQVFIKRELLVVWGSLASVSSLHSVRGMILQARHRLLCMTSAFTCTKPKGSGMVKMALGSLYGIGRVRSEPTAAIDTLVWHVTHLYIFCAACPSNLL